MLLRSYSFGTYMGVNELPVNILNLFLPLVTQPNKQIECVSEVVSAGLQGRIDFSKEFNLDALLVDNYTQLNALRNGINNGHKNGRVNNMLAMANGQAGIKICSGKKTLEYQICKANVTGNKDVIKANWLYELIKRENADDIGKVEAYIDSIGERDLNDMEQQNVALLMWKCLPGKAEFAQTLNSFLIDKIETGDDVKFTVPTYIQEAISHLVL